MSEAIRALDDGGGTDGAAASLVLAVIEHAETAPVGPWAARVAQRAVVDGTGAVWFVESDSVARLVPLSCRCECAELTKYRDGEEISRDVRPTR